ncbi:DUF3630 family protein [Shewanella intestini]|uniref:DUF3630 family protein n=1 Tax=Shewanella intestini TaxID=2017544 RepID=A0ABS5I2B3_9GAMM|nr:MULTISPECIES: DUF3630 family protein [Shewanella]MBR9728171.1 DUF3630 family protein [Shewanella intestini]MRG36642.1 DUF3630 family protein [Shewanella sp. XMDDZSB0408]
MLKIFSVKFDNSDSSLLIEAEVDFDHFEQFAEPLALAMDCEIKERQWGADRHQWRLMFEGTGLVMHYEFYGNICWIKPERPQDGEVIEYLAALIKPLAQARA